LFISQLVFKYYLALLSPSSLEKVLSTFSKSSKKIWHVLVYIFVSNHLNEA
jgi:hypothetical protein